VKYLFKPWNEVIFEFINIIMIPMVSLVLSPSDLLENVSDDIRCTRNAVTLFHN